MSKKGGKSAQRNNQAYSEPAGRQGRKKSRKWLVLVVLILLAAAGGGAWWWFTQNPDAEDGIFGSLGVGGGSNTTPIYSKMTGLEITDPAQNNLPTFCVQIPNGSTDGARPQAGLDQAAVVFEAIAETGITRFAAVFQDLSQAGVIGPIRSLRPYYLDWDTPFDCTVVHDGGSHEALIAVGSGKYRNLDEDFDYMWKNNNLGGQYRYWNNVFTDPQRLQNFNRQHSYNTSAPKTFPRLEPSAVAEALSYQTPCSTEPSDPAYDPACSTRPMPDTANNIHISFTSLLDYMVDYTYDAASNTYKRTYANGDPHNMLSCPATPNPAQDPGNCITKQIAPSAVVAMHVQESTMTDGYHEQIKTIGEGKAEIFQNGTVVRGTWKKSSQNSQIEFRDAAGEMIEFTPGQLWIAAVPQFGGVRWE